MAAASDTPAGPDPDRSGPPARAAFVRFVTIATRWADNDTYGHLNNVVYYALFDSAVNAILIGAGLLDPALSPVIGLVVESNCRFYSSLTYPEPAEVGVAVELLGSLPSRGVQSGRRGGRGGRWLHPCLCRAGHGSPGSDPGASSTADGAAEGALRSWS
jgi:hypothetical protein